MICDRCGDETFVWSGSYFDLSEVCPECLHVEREHPLHAQAVEEETLQVLAGDYNWPGIGVPEDLVELCLAARKAREEGA